LFKQIGPIVLFFFSSFAFADFGIYVADKPGVSLEQAMPIAAREAQAKVPDLDKFLLHSVKPLVFKGDKKGMHWQFLWQEAEFKTHMRGVAVRVYMNDGAAVVEKFQE
jgi:hypothetical protein